MQKDCFELTHFLGDALHGMCGQLFIQNEHTQTIAGQWLASENINEPEWKFSQSHSGCLTIELTYPRQRYPVASQDKRSIRRHNCCDLYLAEVMNSPKVSHHTMTLVYCDGSTPPSKWHQPRQRRHGIQGVRKYFVSSRDRSPVSVLTPNVSN